MFNGSSNKVAERIWPWLDQSEQIYIEDAMLDDLSLLGLKALLIKMVLMDDALNLIAMVRLRDIPKESVSTLEESLRFHAERQRYSKYVRIVNNKILMFVHYGITGELGCLGKAVHIIKLWNSIHPGAINKLDPSMFESRHYLLTNNELHENYLEIFTTNLCLDTTPGSGTLGKEIEAWKTRVGYCNSNKTQFHFFDENLDNLGIFYS